MTTSDTLRRLVAGLALALALPVQAATITVTSGADDGAGPACTLREAVEAATTNAAVGGCTAGDDNDDTIRFDVGVVTLTQGGIQVLSPLTIDGTGAPSELGQVTVYAAPDSYIFSTSRPSSPVSTVEFVNVRMIGGSWGSGGALLAGSFSATTLTDCGLYDSESVRGGAVYVSELGSLTAHNTVFVGNVARTTVSGEGGGAIYTAGGSVTIHGGSFQDNRVLGEAGAGGAIYNPSGATVTVSGARFLRNRAQRGGGGIATVGGTVSLGADFDGNTGGSTPGAGGALHADGDADVTLTGGVVENNRAQRGGAFWIGPDARLEVQDGTTVRNNLAEGAAAGGGGAFVAGGTLEVTGFPSFIDNRAVGAQGAGGAVLVDGGTLLGAGDFRENKARAAGGAIAATGTSTVTLDGSVLSENAATEGDGGAVHLAEGAEVTLAVTAVAFDANTARGSGGALWTSGSDHAVTVTQSELSGNTALGTGNLEGGGGLYVFASLVTVTETTFSGNRTAGGGGALFQRKGDVDFQGSFLTQNRATRGGGAIEVGGNGYARLNAGTRVQGNTTAGTGGGVHVLRVGRFLCNLATISENQARLDGGGVGSAAGGYVQMFRTTVHGNRARHGAGVFHAGENVNPPLGRSILVAGSTISNNVARQEGGGLAIRNDARARISNTTVHGNAARFGGGVHTAEATVDLESMTVAENTASQAGGGLFNQDPPDDGGRFVTLRNTIVADNDAPNRPGLAGRYGSGGYNLVETIPSAASYTPAATDVLGVDPALAPLADNGGPTFTAALTTGSPAHDAGSSLQSQDQRDFSRVLPHDIGAFELGADPGTAAAPAAPAARAEEAGMAEPVRLDAVAPNPVAGRAVATFAVRDAQPVTAALYDVMGRRVEELYAGTPAGGVPVEVRLDASRLAAGTYVLVVEGTTVRATRSVTIVR